jgi:anti-sigma regulatory factor (Ser/Thr protein kinase)
MSDRISLTIPRERPFHRVAHLVLGGLALRNDYTLEQLEDLQIALDALLEHGDGAAADVRVELEVDADRLAAEIGPFEPQQLRAELERDPQDGVGLSRVLSHVVDDVEIADRDGRLWVRLVKAMPVPAEAS